MVPPPFHTVHVQGMWGQVGPCAGTCGAVHMWFRGSVWSYFGLVREHVWLVGYLMHDERNFKGSRSPVRPELCFGLYKEGRQPEDLGW